MKIMKIVYMQECEHSDWDGGNPQKYMGEESWQVGEKFNGEFIQGVVYQFIGDEHGSVDLWVEKPDGRISMAMSIPPHAVQRVYYGEE